ncbi:MULTISPECIES: NADH-ubiquinone oxidoreductase-F iron-sulfur binding region domain-containing protein [Streptomyces]|uniref:NADH-ubiquinone oxidoreductase-F iron-sulfur binding region domain-containing protein n=1 Tax=Streptomyces solicathayae TaxID=3081768 RepID=A0ABZ0M2Y4_9ACTN|nr:NADH-ubiquinone oxidoreductase-F iron-sulfur binding region domain-containing protein [Streptomyces sp. HUAS YS2]WOX26138.1 NADH-ubiquinone oxidoreductase-F iron-sulfur binding region domain-containing protein [Streptomyces sp. HUAS YS2]
MAGRMPGEPGRRPDALRELTARHGGHEGLLPAGLERARAGTAAAPEVWAPQVTAAAGLPAAAGLGPATFFADLAAPRGERHVRVCTATACFAARGGRHLAEVERALGVTAGTVDEAGATSLQTVHCIGYCYSGPAALDGTLPRTGPNLADQLGGRTEPRTPGIPVADTTAAPVLLAGIVGGQDAWDVWREAVARLRPEDVREETAVSGLRGRGGAGFPVADKWAAAAGKPDTVIVANGDEGDPGSYADRLLMEEDPERVLTGLALACFACGAGRGIVLVRSEYPRAMARLRRAVERATQAGDLAPSVGAAGPRPFVEIVEGAGSYVSGEETALIARLEGARGCARPRPPYPTDHGLWDAPTVVNNVETLAAVPWIVAHGGASYARRGVPDETGTKLVCLSERFARPGAYEVELGTPVGEIVARFGDGLKDGHELVALQIGGPLGGFLAGTALDVPLTTAALAAHGSALGHAGMVAFDDSVDPRELLRHVWEFAADESCGACSPCRVGTRRGLGLAQGRGGPGESYERLARLMGQASLCAFGRRVPAAVRSLARAYGPALEGWDR